MMLASLLRMAAPSFLNAGALRAITAGFNHLLGQHPNAATRLAGHAGRRVRMGADGQALGGIVSMPELWLVITSEGRLAGAAEADGPADVEMLIKPSLAAGRALASEGVRGLSAHMRVEGDVLLAGLLGELIDELAWDYEDDLSRVVGDQAAQRVGNALRGGRQSAQDFGNRARDQIRGMTEEAGARGAFGSVARPVYDGLRDTVGRLAERLSRLEERVPAHSKKPASADADTGSKAGGRVGKPGASSDESPADDTR